MNYLLLFLFIVAEIAFVICTFSENAQKAIWFRNRFLINALEFMTFLVFALFPGIDFGFRFIALIFVLIIRILISGITYFCKRRVTGDKKKAYAILSALLSIICIALSLIPSFIFNDYHGRETTGSYEVAMSEAILSDSSRLETFENDGSFREVPVHFYYPVTDELTEFPLIIFSHGAFGYYESNTTTYMELASNGYVVVSLDHPYHSFFCTDTDGKTIIVDMKFMNDVMYINSGNATEQEIAQISTSWIKLRTDDISFVLDTLKAGRQDGALNENWYAEAQAEDILRILKMMNMEKIGVMGHSLGGASAEYLGRIRDDVDAAIDLDGTMLGEQLGLVECEPYEFEGIEYREKYVINEEPYTVPLLSIDNQEHHDSRLEAKKIGMPYANNTILENALDGYETYFANAGHMNYTDLPLFSPFLANMLGTGSIDAGECIDTMNGIVLNFFDSKLKAKGAFHIEECYGN